MLQNTRANTNMLMGLMMRLRNSSIVRFRMLRIC